MAPAVTKRKRTERNNQNQGSERPSPHRPQDLGLAQHNQNTGGGRGGRRVSRGGNRGASQTQQRSPSISSATAQRPVAGGLSSPTAKSSSDPSSKVDPSTSIPNPISQAPTSPASMSGSPYFYQFVTDERTSKWQNSGRAELISDALKRVHSKEIISLNIVFQELTRAVLSGRLRPADAGAAVKEILDETSTTASSLPSNFLDCVSCLVEAGLPDANGLREFLISTGVSASLMREQLEASVLVSLNLVRSTFAQMGTRYSTSVLYKQTTYNLLREDTEGFAKLITEYFSTAENNPPSSEVTSDTFQKVKALIGTFNLDPGRTLDVTLDVFANLLVKQYKFFVKFLRGSSFWPQQRTVDGVEREDPGFSSLPKWAAPDYTSWNTSEADKQLLEGLKQQRDTRFWDRVREAGMQAYFELGGRRAVIKEEHPPLGDNNQDADQEWISATGTYPPHGNKIAAQLLGFKLRFYASEHRDKTDVLPENIIFLAALLIHIGFISLRDLYPHLYPPDKAMPEVEQKLMKEKAEREEKKRPGGGQNALTKAGALIDDTIPQPRLREPIQRVDLTIDKSAAPSKPDEAEEPELPEPENQKIVLLRSLLLIGAIPEALFILGRFPWLIDACPELPEHVFRLLHHTLSKVYAPLRPLYDRESIRQPKPVVGEQAGLPKGHLKTSSPSNRKTLRWAKLDSYDSAKISDYRYYFDEWSDNVPVCQNVDDVFSLCSTFLGLVGVRIGQDAELLTKLARIGRRSLDEDTSELNLARWQDLCKRILVPALSLTKGNTGVVSEIWELLKTFSIQTRFSIYAEWYGGPTSRHPEIKVAFDLTRAETKDVLKRISKTNARMMARALGKVADTSPGVVYAVTLNQIESYNNLIDVVVDGARYFTSLGFDVLTWSIMNSLGGGSRNRVQADGMLTSPWLRALSVFAGNTFRHYKMMNPSPILRYIADQLRKGNSTDLEILEQIITSMAGIRSDTKYGEEAVQALSGGPLLRDLTLRQLHDRRHESRSQTRRLLRALNESNLAGQLLVLIAQERQLYIFRDSASDAPLKVLGNNLDKIHDAFVQYLDMLRSNLSVEEFDSVVPSIPRLIEDSGLDASLAFTICRPSIRALMHGDNQKSEDKNAPSNGEVQVQEAASKDPEAHANGKSDQVDSPGKAPGLDRATEVEMVDAPSTGDDSGSFPGPNVSQPWHPVLESLIQDLKPVLPVDFEENMSLSFYVRFWQLDLHDMFVPSYETESKRLQERLKAVTADRSDVSRDGVKRKEAEKKRLTELHEGIRAEMKSHMASYQAIWKKLTKEKDHWFTHLPISKHHALTDALIQECFFPRMILSPQDAQFTAKYVFFIHHIGTPGFRTLHFFDQLLREKQILATLFQCTAREAENFGRFLNDSLKELRRWSLDKAVYDKMAHGVKKDLPGCASKLNPDQSPKVFRDYEDFRRLLYKWHRQLHGAVKECLTSGEYMHIRNAIILIKAVHKQWPEINYQGDQTIAAITELSKNDPRDDLKLSAQSLMGDLTKRKKNWVPPQAFMLMVSESYTMRILSSNVKQPNDPAQTKGPNRNVSIRPITPQPTSKNSRPLDPMVPEFKSIKESYVLQLTSENNLLILSKEWFGKANSA